ncbi:MAG: phosphate/phosphite/phosphonate ABC transporter substrate-binding protein [Planctomycetes bacterium]|nr:phosphate/phosphite/phosphonate ABC transporter substrate-binding protein [Planctomycetota bacterium]
MQGSTSGTGDAKSGSNRLVLAIIATAGLLIVVLVWLVICPHAVRVRLRHGDVVAPRPPESPIRLAVAPVLSPERTVEDYYHFSRYLSVRLQHPVLLVQRKTYGEVNELLRQGNVHVGIICTGAYLRMQGGADSLEAVAVPVYSGGMVYYSLIVVRKESGTSSMEDLRGRRFAFTDPLSLTGFAYPSALLTDLGYDPRTFFSAQIFTHSHDGSLRSVLDGTMDGAAVDSLVYDFEVQRDPSIGERLRIVHRSPPLGISPVVLAPGLDPKLRDAIKTTLLDMNKDAEGRRALEHLGIQRFEEPAPGLYENAAEILRKAQVCKERNP